MTTLKIAITYVMEKKVIKKPLRYKKRVLSAFTLLMTIVIFVDCRGFWKENNSTFVTSSDYLYLPKQITVNTLPLREIWRWSGTIRDGSQKVIIRDETIIVAASEKNRDKLIVFEAQSGHLRWESLPTFERLQSLTANDKRVYAGYRLNVKAYDLMTGQQLWIGAQQSKYKKGSLYINADNEYVTTYDASSNWPHDRRAFILDAKTGETVEVIEWSGIYFYKEDVVYSRKGPTETGFMLVAQDKRTQNILWSLPNIAHPPRRWPILVENIMYIEAGDIYALNNENGQVVWRSDAAYSEPTEADPINLLPANDRASPIVYNGVDLIYIVRNDAVVVGLDVENGEVVGSISMTPLPPYQDKDGLPRRTSYLVAASEEFVAVYFDDSQELIVFEQEK